MHGQGLPVERSVAEFLFQQFCGDVLVQALVKRLHNLSRQRRHLAIHVDHSALDSVFVGPGQRAHGHLQGNRHQDRVWSQLDEVHAHIKGQHVGADGGLHQRSQFIKFDWRRPVQFGKRFQTVKFLGVVVLVEEALTQILNAAEAVRLVGQTHGFHVREAGVGNVQHGVLFRAVHGHCVSAATAIVYKLDLHFLLIECLQVAVAPHFERKCLRLAAAFFLRTLVGAAHGVGVNAVGLAVHDVDAPAVRLPARESRGIVLIGILDAAVVLFLVLIFRGVGRGIAPLPELFDEYVPFRVVAQLLERGLLFISNDPGLDFIQPLLVNSVQSFFDCTFIVRFAWPLQRIFFALSRLRLSG